jgi:hypothetical protein
MRLFGFLQRFNVGDPVAKVCDTRDRNRSNTIWETIECIGARLEKPTNLEGDGWRLIVGDGSDLPLPEGFPEVLTTRS